MADAPSEVDAPKKIVKSPTSIWYMNIANYTESASIIRDHFFKNIHDLSAIGIEAHEKDVVLDLQQFADYLERGVTYEAFNEFMRTDFGKGILLGNFLEYMAQQQRDEEDKIIAEMEGE
jgi:hypothetical protein